MGCLEGKMEKSHKYKGNSEKKNVGSRGKITDFEKNQKKIKKCVDITIGE